MKKIKYWSFLMIIFATLYACKDESNEITQSGNPELEVKSEFSNVHFGDLLPFEVNVNDNIPLSVLTVKLFYGDEEVAKTTIRTKENGNYKGTIKVPFMKNIPDGNATLEFVLINTTMKKTEKAIEVPVKRAQYPYLLLVTESGTYPMIPTGKPNEYAATEAFPSTDLPAYIKTPAIDNKGNEILFGWESGKITHGVRENIPFVSPIGGSFSVTFNTLTYAASPFFEILVNGQKMAMADKETFTVDIDLKQNEEIVVEGLDDIANWWIDRDYFTKKSSNKFNFVPISGKYRMTASLKYKYFRMEVMEGNEPAKLKADGTGAIWIIGEKVGKPSVKAREVGWDTSKALCMAPIGNKKYQLTVVGDETIKTDAINFKFFHQNNWGGEFSSTTLTTSSNLIFIGDGKNGRDNGNLGIVEGKTLEKDVTYVFIIDLSAGIDKGVLTVTKK